VHEPQISLTGNLAFDPEVRFTPNGVPVTDLRVATTRRFKVGEEWQDGETLWFDVACWNKLAENAGTSLKKGDKVTVTGRLLQKTWTRDDGTSSVKLVIDASTVGVDLGRFPVKVEKPIRVGGAADALADEHDAWVDRTTGEMVSPGEDAPATEEELAA
jgi:single-strand DNA-binding protein